jgi:AcrR family transcriptional regulator
VSAAASSAAKTVAAKTVVAKTVVARAAGRPRDAQVDEAILEAALDLLIDAGYFGMSMAAVALRAGVAKTTLYRRWPTKEDLVVDALARIKGEFVVPPPGAVRERVLFCLEQSRRHWNDRRQAQLMQRLISDGIERPAQYRRIRAQFITPRRNVIRDCLQRGVDAGELDPNADLNWAVDLLVGPLVAAGLTHQRRFSVAQTEFVVDTVLRGLSMRGPVHPGERFIEP